MLDKKLQLKDGQTIALVGSYPPLPLVASQVNIEDSDSVLLFVATEAVLRQNLSVLQMAVADSKLTWIAYPKSRKLNTDLNRDIIRAIVNENGLDTVRQIALDEMWSALRLKSLQP